MLGIVPMGGRSTAIKLDSAGVWILASTELNNETKQKLDELGDVKLVLPLLIHSAKGTDNRLNS